MKYCLLVLLLASLVSVESRADQRGGLKQTRFYQCAIALIDRIKSWGNRFPSQPPLRAVIPGSSVIGTSRRAVADVSMFARDLALLDLADPRATSSIHDGYLRLESFGVGMPVSDRELAGLALLVAGRAGSLYEADAVFDLTKWRRELSPDLGLRVRSPPLPNREGKTKSVVNRSEMKRPEIDIRSAQIREFAEKWGMLTVATDVSQRRQRVTVFGSSVGNPEVNERSFRLGQQLAKHGFATVTGGAGGVMEATNRGAFGEGGVSIGIPIDAARVNLPNERIPAIESHTLTLRVSGYRTRIPLLLNTDAIVFMPGTEGTLRELGASLLKFERTKLPLVFLGASYWEPVVEAIHRALPEAERKWIQLVDSEESALKQILSLLGGDEAVTEFFPVPEKD